MIGQSIKHYKITGKLGEGGMGEVYLAEDTKLNRQVALKFLPRLFSSDPDARARFQREAKALATLNHPNIVTVFDVSEHDGQPFIAMEYLEGLSLKEIIASTDLDTDRVIDYVSQIAEGLAAAHKAAVIHRDVKSENIIVSPEGRVKIMDFGLATWHGVTQITQEGSTLGTMAYMSPEQTQGKDVDQRADLWSLGVVLYEMLTRRLPFEGEHQAAIVYAIVQEPPHPPARYRADIPSGLTDIVAKALEKNPETRYQTATGILADLRRLKAAEPSLAGSPSMTAQPRRTTRTNWMLSAATLAVIATLLLVFKPWKVDFQPTNEAVAKRKMLAVLPFQNLGSEDQNYFADGMTEEIITHVAQVSGLGVISRTSSMKYKNSEKSLREIGAELGVDYILEGTVRWDRRDTVQRVRINPQLIRVSDDTHLWAESYDRDLSEIFAVQTDIAQQIVLALDVTLLEPERKALAGQPTQNLDAYEAYLRGRDYINRPDFSADDSRMAVNLFDRAVALDSTFALAYVWLSRSLSRLHFQGSDRSENLLVRSKDAVDRALAMDPELPIAHVAMGIYYYRSDRDYDRALQHFKIAEERLSNDPEVMRWFAFTYRRQGRFEETVEQLQRAMALNPRDSQNANELVFTYVPMRLYEKARQFANRSIALAPDQALALVHLARILWLESADLLRSRKALEAIPVKNDKYAKWLWVHQEIFEGNYEAALDRLDEWNFQVFESQWAYEISAQLKGFILTLMGKHAEAIAAFEQARTLLEQEMTARPDDDRVHSSLGVVYAALGRKDDAVREGRRGVELFPVSRDAIIGPYRIMDLAHIHVLCGDHDAAIDRLEYLLSIPAWLSGSMLKLDPKWAPLRDHPRFQALLKQKGVVF